MSIPLKPGDRCSRLVNGRKLKGVIVDFIAMPIRGESGNKARVPFKRRKNIVWVLRGELRKLPERPQNVTRLTPKQKLVQHLESKVKTGEMSLRQAAEALRPPVKEIQK